MEEMSISSSTTTEGPQELLPKADTTEAHIYDLKLQRLTKN